MCGISGILEQGRAVDREVLARMNNALRHRGPDDESYYLCEGGGDRVSVGLGSRRLAIIDLQGGRQPMTNESGTVQLVFNGAIYNFRELRAVLEAKGHVFCTHSDTEVIIHLYEEHGADCVARLNGMFAFALWDTNRQVLLLARDRMGEKPVYYSLAGRQFLFASEVKALLQHPACVGELDREALAKYLAYEYVPSPHCIFKGICKLPAGHTLVVQRAGEGFKVQMQRYWDLTFAQTAAGKRPEAYVDELRSRLQAAVRSRLVSDVPVGVFLSGGIDSSSVVAMMAELLPASQIKTFSIGFEEASFDESAPARTVADFFGTDHHEQILRPQTLVDILPEVAAFLDEPFADASIIPTYLLAKFTRQQVKVALGGDGGDELFAGYPTFQAHRLASCYRVPRAVHERVIVPLAERLPVSPENFSFDFKVKQFLRGMFHRPAERNQIWLGAFTPLELRELLDGFVPEPDVYADLRAMERQGDGKGLIEQLLYLYCKFYLADDILVKLDRATMACSLEARTPFLDHTFVEFAGRIPAHLKLNGLTTKYILKEAMRNKLPAGIATRRKKGFGIPVAKWFKTCLKELVADALSERFLKQQGIFRPEPVRRLLDEHLSGAKDNRKKLWTLFMFQMWHERYMNSRVQSVPESTGDSTR